MKVLTCLIVALAISPIFAQQPPTNATNATWVLDSSTLTYHMSYPIHEVEGSSHAAKGKAVCHDGQCDFLLAAPVKSFDSGDTNRDLHMVQVTKGGKFPYVTVRFHLPETALDAPTINCDLEVQFAKVSRNSCIPVHRERRILGRLHQDGQVNATALAEEFSISEDTIRRDLRELAVRAVFASVFTVVQW